MDDSKLTYSIAVPLIGDVPPLGPVSDWNAVAHQVVESQRNGVVLRVDTSSSSSSLYLKKKYIYNKIYNNIINIIKYT